MTFSGSAKLPSPSAMPHVLDWDFFESAGRDARGAAGRGAAADAGAAAGEPTTAGAIGVATAFADAIGALQPANQ